MALEVRMAQSVNLGGVFTPTGTNLKLNRLGYGTLQLAGEMAWGPPRDHDEAIRVVREAVRLGVSHIDTSDFYGPHIANEIIREAIFVSAKGAEPTTIQSQNLSRPSSNSESKG
jgi:pyridoxine 4-dehydrogenase